MQQPTALRFVVQEHRQGEAVHWDLMLQMPPALSVQGKLATWRLSVLPGQEQAVNLPAIKTFDHRPMYLDYEGPISGQLGQVRIVQQGSYILIDHQADQWTVEFFGGDLNGKYIIKSLEASGRWQLIRMSQGHQ